MLSKHRHQSIFNFITFDMNHKDVKIQLTRYFCHPSILTSREYVGIIDRTMFNDESLVK